MSAFSEAQGRHAALIEAVPYAEGWRAMQAVIEHHKPVDQLEDGNFTTCEGCDPGDYAEGAAGWPCSTVRLIAAEFNVILPS